MVARNRGIARRVVSVVSSVALALSLCPFGQAFAIEPGGQPSEPNDAVVSLDAETAFEVYVSKSGSDENGHGSAEQPYASLAKAFEVVNDSDGDSFTVYVMSDLVATESARYWDADVTLTSMGGPWTISRGDDFAVASDQQRSSYNGPIIEAGNTGSLTITNLVIDDGGKREGSHFVQVQNDNNGRTDIGGVSVPNSDVVQDAMITTFSPSFTITLGDGCKLKNFGGMSAVRVANGELVMQSGSEIFDDPSGVERKKQTGDYGYAGAVWVQSGKLTVQQGASIHHTSGHAAYADLTGSNVTINGEIHDIKTDKQNAWQGENGGALHLRGGAVGVVNGKISNVAESGSFVYITGGGASRSSFTLNANALIDGNEANIVGVQLDGNNGIDANVNGKITGMGNSAIHVNNNIDNTPAAPESMHLTIGPDGVITGNTGGYGNVTVQTNGGQVDIYGKIVGNSSNLHSGLCMANNKNEKTITLHDGAEISGNYSGGGIAGVRVSLGTLVMEDGAKVENNVCAANSARDDGSGAGVVVLKSGKFIMNGGCVANNASASMGGGVTVRTDDDTYAQLNGGSLTGGRMNAAITTGEDGVSVTGGNPNDLTVVGGSTHGSASRYLSVSDEVSLSEKSVFMDDYDFFLETPGDDVKLGNASYEAESTAIDAYKDNEFAVKGSFWFQSDRASETFAISQMNFDDKKPVYAAVVPTNEDGTSSVDKTTSLIPVEIGGDGEAVSATVPTSSATGQAVVFLQEGDQSASVVSITPVDLTSYMGGEGGYAGDGTIPEPGFLVSCPNGVDAANVVLSATIDGTSHSWGFEKLDASNGKEFYRLVSADEEGNGVFPVKFLNSTGESVRDDGFEFDTALSQTIFVRAFDGVSAKAKFLSETGGDVEAIVSSGVGELTVRGTTKGEKYASPNAGLSVGQPGLKTPEGTGYAVNGGGVEVADKKGIALLFDDIIETNGISMNADLLEAHAEQKCFVGEDGDRSYEFKYLDLVDRNNGNVWVEASEPVTVCWPLPEGTDSGDKFTVLHFKGLHREMGVGYIESEIDKSDVEKLDCRVVGDHVEFEVTSGNFSPFALVWTEDGGGSVTPPQPQTVTLHYETNGGRPLADEIHVLGTKADLKTPLREGCTFAGWYLDEALTKPAEDPLTMDADKTVWAKWESTAVPGGFTSDHVNYVLGRDTDQGRLIMPESNITRAEAAAMFYRLLDEGTRAEYYRESSTFPDVEPGAWYEPAVGTLQAMGILRGDDGVGTVRPDDPITRAELAAMAGRFDDDGEWPDMEPFADMDGHWAERIVLVAAENGWVLGVEGSDKFRPDDPITRAETMAIANRVLQRLPEDESDLIAGRVQWPDNQDKEKWYWLAVEEATNNHDHTLKSDGVHERWTALLENEDWGE